MKTHDFERNRESSGHFELLIAIVNTMDKE